MTVTTDWPGRAEQREFEPFRPQLGRVRPLQFETPESYLVRLSRANAIDPTHIARLTQVRRQRTGRLDELAYVIAELGGPPVGHFTREYARAFVHERPLLNKVFAAHRSTRRACTRCAGGDEVQTFDHRRFVICLKHDRWVGRGGQRQVVDYELRTVERHFRRIAATGLIPPFAHDRVVATLDQNAGALGSGLWRGHRPHSREPIDRYPALVRILQVLADYLAAHWPRECEIQGWHRRPEQHRLYDYLRPRLAWLGEPTELWKATDDLVEVAIDIITSRSAEFAHDIAEPRRAREPKS